jgi:hypothetical protein
MRAPIFPSPIVLASAAFAAGLVVKWVLKAEFSVGGTMVVVLWLPPLIGLVMAADVVPDRLGRGRHSLCSFFSRENWLELLALLALPSVGFAVDVASPSLSTVAFASIGIVGIIACVQLVMLERKKRALGHDL